METDIGSVSGYRKCKFKISTKSFQTRHVFDFIVFFIIIYYIIALRFEQNFEQPEFGIERKKGMAL